MGRTPWGVAVLTTLLAGIGVQYGAGLVSPGNAFVPPWMEWAHNGLFYVFGLALYAHRQVLLAHDGTIEIDSAPSGGALFRLTL